MGKTTYQLVSRISAINSMSKDSSPCEYARYSLCLGVLRLPATFCCLLSEKRILICGKYMYSCNDVIWLEEIDDFCMKSWFLTCKRSHDMWYAWYSYFLKLQCNILKHLVYPKADWWLITPPITKFALIRKTWIDTVVISKRCTPDFFLHENQNWCFFFKNMWYWHFSGLYPSKVQHSPWRVTFPIGKDLLPSTIFQGRAVKLRGGIFDEKFLGINPKSIARFRNPWWFFGFSPIF